MNLKALLLSKWTRWVVSTLLIILLLWISDISLILQTMSLAKWQWLAVAYLVAVLLTAFGAVKWWVLMPRSRTGPLSFIRVNFISNFVGIFFPGIVGIEAARIAGITRSSNDLPAAVASVLVDRTFGLFSLGLVVAIGGLFGHDLVPVFVTLGCSILLVCILLATLLLMNYRFRHFLARVLPVKVNHAASKLFECLDLYRDRRATLLLSLMLSLTFQLLRVIMAYLLAISLSIDVEFRYLLIVIPVALFVQMLPVSVYGIGIRESAMITLLAVVGVSSESAFALSILLLAIQIASVFPGGVLFAMGQRLESTDHGKGESLER